MNSGIQLIDVTTTTFHIKSNDTRKLTSATTTNDNLSQHVLSHSNHSGVVKLPDITQHFSGLSEALKPILHYQHQVHNIAHAIRGL